MHTQRRAVLERDQRPEHDQVQDRERQQHALAQLGPVGARRRRDRAGQEQVVVAVHGALRKAGGAARVGDRGRASRVRSRRARRVASPVAPDAARCRPRTDPGVGATRLRPRPARPRNTRAPESRSSHAFSGAARAARLIADPDRAEPRGAEERDHDVDVVGQARGDPVARARHRARRARWRRGSRRGRARAYVMRPLRPTSASRSGARASARSSTSATVCGPPPGITAACTSRPTRSAPRR